MIADGLTFSKAYALQIFFAKAETVKAVMSAANANFYSGRIAELSEVEWKTLEDNLRAIARTIGPDVYISRCWAIPVRLAIAEGHPLPWKPVALL